MIDWLFSPIDPLRMHEVGYAISWHARLMVLGWGVLAPLAVLMARYFKVLPGQDWPQELDNQLWWRSHWIGHSAVFLLSGVGFVLVLPTDFSAMSLHNWLGYGLLFGVVVQVALGLFRGNKGGPTAPQADGSLRGHHYDMTPWRRTFEALHKSLGYGLLVLAALTILLGLWKANGPVWMWLALIVWWAGLIVASIVMQRRGMAIDTYQAIWGVDPAHPGNTAKQPGWGVRRITQGDTRVRRD